MWNTTEPPKDRPIVAVGGIMLEDAEGKVKMPFTEEIRWSEGDNEWVLAYQGLTLRREQGDKVIIHYWIDLPEEKPTPSPAEKFVNMVAGMTHEGELVVSFRTLPASWSRMAPRPAIWTHLRCPQRTPSPPSTDLSWRPVN